MTPEETDWRQIVGLYGELVRVAPSPVIELNRAAAVAMADGPEAGLALVDRIDGLERYHLLHAARADLLRRLDRYSEAAAAYEEALAARPGPVERRFLERRLAEMRDFLRGRGRDQP
jgi:RNA polymerase sigma-70 factor (ECF subfamily)